MSSILEIVMPSVQKRRMEIFLAKAKCGNYVEMCCDSLEYLTRVVNKTTNAGIEILTFPNHENYRANLAAVKEKLDQVLNYGGKTSEPFVAEAQCKLRLMFAEAVENEPKILDKTKEWRESIVDKGKSLATTTASILGHDQWRAVIEIAIDFMAMIIFAVYDAYNNHHTLEMLRKEVETMEKISKAFSRIVYKTAAKFELSME